MKTALCTISSNNFLPYGLTCLTSVAKFNDYDLFYLIADEFEGDLYNKYEDKITFVKLNQLNKTEAELANLEFKYNIVEFNTCVKPAFYQYLFSLGYENVIYLDPDIECYDKLSYLDNLLESYSIVLTPHKNTSKKSSFFDENAFLNNGIYNLGFIAMHKSTETDRFLNWWDFELKDGCYLDYSKGFATDQIWLNLVPVYFDNVYISKHPGMNIAFWNIDERNISDNLTVDSKKIQFIHYSSMSVNCRMELLDKIFFVSPEFKDIYDSHINTVKSFDFELYSSQKYKFDYFDNGMKIPPQIKRFYGYSEFNRLDNKNPFSTDKGSFFYELSKNKIKCKKENLAMNEKKLNKLIKIFGLKNILNLSRYFSAINVSNISKLYE